MNVEHGTGRLLSIKYSPLLNLNQPTSHSGPAAPQWDNSDLIIAFIQPPKPVIANSDDLANNDDIHSCLIEIFLGDCISNSGMKFYNENINHDCKTHSSLQAEIFGKYDFHNFVQRFIFKYS